MMERMVEAGTGGHIFEFVAGRLCLDFTNTTNYGSATPSEQLNCYADLAAWSRQAGTLTAREAARLLREAGRRPAEAATVLERALALRSDIYRIFSAVAAGKTPAEADVARLNLGLAGMLAHSRLAPRPGDTFTWAWAGEETALERVLWPVTWSAAELLTSEVLARVGECAGESCGWLFLDTSRNHSRRWCDMKECGNRAKVRRHYHRWRARPGR